MPPSLHAFARELEKTASPLIGNIAKSSLMGMAFEAMLNRDATPLSVIREGVGYGVGDELASHVAGGMGAHRLARFAAGMAGGHVLSSALRRRFNEKPVQHAIDKLPDTEEFKAVKQAAATRSVLTPQSSNVAGYSYDPATESLNVTFKGGGTYAYKGVPKRAVRNLARSKSVGKAINRIKATSEYEKVGAPLTHAQIGQRMSQRNLQLIRNADAAPVDASDVDMTLPYTKLRAAMKRNMPKVAKLTAFGEDHYDEADDAGWKDRVPGGPADDKFPSDFDFDALDAGMKHELERTKDRNLAMEIAMDHLTEDPAHYAKQKLLEKQGAWEDKKEKREVKRSQIAAALGSVALPMLTAPLLVKGTKENLATSRKRTVEIAKAMGLPSKHTKIVPGSAAFVGKMKVLSSGKDVGPILRLPPDAARDVTIAHELGHYKNSLKFSDGYHKAHYASRRLITNPLGGLGLAVGSTYLSGTTDTPTYLPAAAVAALSAPTLFEEAAASARATRYMMKAHGGAKGLVKSLGLLPALGTYAIPAMAPALVTFMRKRYRANEGATDDDKMTGKLKLGRGTEKTAGKLKKMEKGAAPLKTLIEAAKRIKGVAPSAGPRSYNLIASRPAMKEMLRQKGKTLTPKIDAAVKGVGGYGTIHAPSKNSASVLENLFSNRRTPGPQTKRSTDGFHATNLIHESFERAVRPRDIAPLASHLAPSVLLKEHNLFSKMTGGSAASRVKAVNKNVRGPETGKLKSAVTALYGDRAGQFFEPGRRIPKAMIKDFGRNARRQIDDSGKAERSNFARDFVTKREARRRASVAVGTEKTADIAKIVRLLKTPIKGTPKLVMKVRSKAVLDAEEHALRETLRDKINGNIYKGLKKLKVDKVYQRLEPIIGSRTSPKALRDTYGERQIHEMANRPFHYLLGKIPLPGLSAAHNLLAEGQQRLLRVPPPRAYQMPGAAAAAAEAAAPTAAAVKKMTTKEKAILAAKITGIAGAGAAGATAAMHYGDRS